jgi:hypothetical protein
LRGPVGIEWPTRSGALNEVSSESIIVAGVIRPIGDSLRAG